jgi:uncharacterized protein YhbP (UPF0306 family)
MPTGGAKPPTDLSRRLNSYLDRQTTLTLATLSEDGTPHACDLFYVQTRDLVFYFLSDAKTRHVQNLLLRPRVAATIHGLSRGWEDIRGVQIEGQAERVTGGEERAGALAAYLIKYAFVRRWLTGVEQLGVPVKGLGTIELFKIHPRWVRFVDNSLGFGHKEEMTLPD